MRRGAKHTKHQACEYFYKKGFTKLKADNIQKEG